MKITYKRINLLNHISATKPTNKFNEIGKTGIYNFLPGKLKENIKKFKILLNSEIKLRKLEINEIEIYLYRYGITAYLPIR